MRYETIHAEAGQITSREVYDSTAGTFTVFGPTGAVVSSRALTAAEASKYAALEAAAAAAAATAQTAAANTATIRTRAENALAANTAFLALGAPTNAQVLAQTQVLTKECTGIIRLLLGLLDTTAGT